LGEKREQPEEKETLTRRAQGAMHKMRIIAVICFALALAATCPPDVAQHGSAGSGYFPPGYGGDTFSGKVTKVDDETREVTLDYSAAGKKPETFVGPIDKDYTAHWKDGTVHPLKPSDFPIGTQLTVYYMVKQIKGDGKKKTTNTIFQIKEAPNVGRALR
jgi:hypothetical protein